MIGTNCGGRRPVAKIVWAVVKGLKLYNKLVQVFPNLVFEDVDDRLNLKKGCRPSCGNRWKKKLVSNLNM